MKCQILFSGKHKKNNIILSSAENAQRVVKVKQEMTFHKHYSQKIDISCVSYALQTIRMTYQALFLWKIHFRMSSSSFM